MNIEAKKPYEVHYFVKGEKVQIERKSEETIIKELLNSLGIQYDEYLRLKDEITVEGVQGVKIKLTDLVQNEINAYNESYESYQQPPLRT
jgi:hypothetical protein